VDEGTWRRAALTRTGGRKSNGWGKGANPKGSHLFLHGVLRRGECEGPMVPRTGPNRQLQPYGVYICHNRDRFGRDHCSQPPVKRRVVDKTALTYLRSVGDDILGHRERLRASIRTQITDLGPLGQQADLDTAETEPRLDRVRRDYQDGRISTPSEPTATHQPS